MYKDLLSLLPLIAPVLLYGYALSVLQKKNTNGANFISLFGILTASISGLIVYQFGALQSGLLGWAGLGFSIRLDALSVMMLIMISLLGFVILKFSKNYLDGDARKHVFFGRLAATIASVELLILSGNLFQIFTFWVATSFCLHYLLVFYRNRPQAIAAARKKFIVARLGDFSLLAAILLIYFNFGTGDLTTLFQSVTGTGFLNTSLTWATILLVLSAVLKSAQFPTHGWLIEVVETPTPVSALLHAGLLNAGPFLMVRLSPLMIESTSASLALICIGGFTALFASVVYLTQPSIKISLGYSSVAHMGFSLLICGFGVYSAAILHVVAHSFYKAHSFLSSGSVVDVVRARKVKLSTRKGNIGNIILGVASSIGIYLFFCYLWGVNPETDFNLMAVGAIIVMGLSQLLVNAMDSKGSIKAVLISGALAFIVALAFFSLESGTEKLLQAQLPISHEPTTSIMWATFFVIASYSIVILIQLMAPMFKKSNLGYRLGIHLRNGLYANVLFDRVIGSLKHEKFKWANLEIKEVQGPNASPKISDTVSKQKIEAL